MRYYLNVNVMRNLLLVILFALTLQTIAKAQGSEGKCPVITVTDGGIVSSGQPFVFRATVVGGPEKVVYKWRTSEGAIIMGQGTNEIQVTNVTLGGGVTAIVSVEGLPSNCLNEASENVIYCVLPTPTLIDEYAGLSWEKEKEHFDAIKASIEKDPNSQIYIIIYHRKNRATATDLRIGKIKEYFKSDQNYLTFITEISDKENTKIFSVPPGSERPRP